MCSTRKKGVSANQLHRTLGCTLKTAWFVAHRLRAAMDPFYNMETTPTLGGVGKIIEMDETFVARRGTFQATRRSCAQARRYEPCGTWRRSPLFPLGRVDSRTMKQVVDANVKRETIYYTDGWHGYRNNAMQLAGHDWVDHS